MAVLKLTDGDWEINLTRTSAGWILVSDGWSPNAARLSSTYATNVNTDGEQLRHSRFINSTEALSVKLDFNVTDDLINQVDMLQEMLMVRAPDYFENTHNNSPVWFERQATDETNIAYALINEGRLILPPDALDDCTLNNGKLFPAQITFSRQPFWLGARPGQAQATTLSSAQQNWAYAKIWAQESVLPAGEIWCMIQDDYGSIWAGGDSEILQWNGAAWAVVNTAPIVLGEDVRGAAKLANGDILFGGDGRVIKRTAAGVWSEDTTAVGGLVRAMLIAKDTGEVFIGDDSRIMKRSTAGVWGVETTLPSDNIFCLAQAGDGRMFAGGAGNSGEILMQVTAPEIDKTGPVLTGRTDNAEQYNSTVSVPPANNDLDLFNRNYVGLRFTLDVPAGAHIDNAQVRFMIKDLVYTRVRREVWYPVPQNPSGPGGGESVNPEPPSVNDPPPSANDQWRLEYEYYYVPAWGTSLPLKIYCEAIDNAPVFANTANNISGRSLTTAYRSWQDSISRNRNKHFRSPDISYVLQEVIDRPGWVSGQSVVVIFKCDDLSYSSNHIYRRQCWDWTGCNDQSPKLEVTYTTDVSAGWELSTTAPEATVRAMLQVGNTMFAAESDDIWGSSDAGKSWKEIVDLNGGSIRSLYQDSLGVFWVGADGNIFKSVDGGRNFYNDSTLPTGTVSAMVEEFATGDLRAGDDGGARILLLDESDEITLGRSSTIEDEVLITNHHKTAQITHIKIDDGGAFSDIFPMAGSLPAALLPAVPAVNDALYVGIDTSLADTGPFFGVIWDIGTVAASTTSYTLLAEYWDGGNWQTLTVHDETNQFSEPGVNGIFYQNPSDLVAVAVDGDTAYWVRWRVSALTGTLTPPTQQNREVYTPSWPFIQVLDTQTQGNINSLVRAHLRARADEGGPGGSAPTLYSNRIICGIKETANHAQFRSFLNFADEQNPTGVTIDVSVDPDSATSIETDTNYSSATGKRVFIDAGLVDSGNGLNNWEDRANIDLATTIARDFYGSYKIFLRGKQQGGSAGEVSLRIKVVSGSGGISSVGDIQVTQSTTDHELIEFERPIRIPVSSLFTANEVGDATSIVVQSSHSQSDADLYLYDIVLISTDGPWVDCVDTANNAQSSIEEGRRLDIDNITIPKGPTRALTRRMRTDDLISSWRVDGELHLIAGKNQRLWFLAARTTAAASDIWISEPEVCHSVTVEKTDRWIMGRGRA